MRKKLYTAFLSSNYSGLKNERSIAIKKLLDANVFPVTMEHFVIGSTDGFKDICELIDDSDVFILLMGTRYGSRDERGDNKSWTEKEFDYARANGKKMLIVRFAPLDALAKSYRDDMTDEEVIALCPDQSADDTRAQLSFARSIDRENGHVRRLRNGVFRRNRQVSQHYPPRPERRRLDTRRFAVRNRTGAAAGRILSLPPLRHAARLS